MSLARTPVGKFGGSMSAVSGPNLAAIAVREAVARAGSFFASVLLAHFVVYFIVYFFHPIYHPPPIYPSPSQY